MKRFYCTICKKVKRVRRLPLLQEEAFVLSPDGEGKQLNNNVEMRKGECRHHAGTLSRREYFNRLHTHTFHVRKR